MSCVEVPAREPSTKRAFACARLSGASSVMPVPVAPAVPTAVIVRTSGSPAPKPLAAWSTVILSPTTKLRDARRP